MISVQQNVEMVRDIDRHYSSNEIKQQFSKLITERTRLNEEQRKGFDQAIDLLARSPIKLSIAASVFSFLPSNLTLESFDEMFDYAFNAYKESIVESIVKKSKKI